MKSNLLFVCGLVVLSILTGKSSFAEDAKLLLVPGKYISEKSEKGDEMCDMQLGWDADTVLVMQGIGCKPCHSFRETYSCPYNLKNEQPLCAGKYILEVLSPTKFVFVDESTDRNVIFNLVVKKKKK